LKTLYFEGAGCVPRGDLENCRIRTAFHTDDGTPLFLEIVSIEVTDLHRKSPELMDEIGGCIAFGGVTCHPITKDTNTIVNAHYEKRSNIPYCRHAILRYINNVYGCNFDAIEVLPLLSGYHVHRSGKPGGVNYGDAFVPDRAAIAERESLLREIIAQEKRLGCRHPCVCLWVDETDGSKVCFHHPRTGQHFEHLTPDQLRAALHLNESKEEIE
jgi:hypothetical protein